MIELSTLGAIELRRDGNDVRSLLSQPKRLALLVYLRLAAGGFVSRDRLLALLWPESDPERARNALRQSLHFLRRSLGDQVVVSRAEQEVGIAPGTVACDAVAFEEALDAGRLEVALEIYRGDLLPGFHVDDAPELERWIDEMRGALARRAVDAARVLSERDEARGEWAAAAVWARRLVTLDPLSESATRRLATLLARSGERAQALEALGELTARLAAELELEPSAETLALASEIRDGADTPAVAGASAAPPTDRPTAQEASAGRRPTVAESPAGPPLTGPPRARPPRRSARLAAVPIAGAALLVAAGALFGPRLREAVLPRAEAAPAIAVMPFLDMSQGGGREYFADGVAEELLNVLARVPGLRVAARTSSFAFRGSDATADSIGTALGVTHLLEGSVRTEGQRVRVTVQLIETRRGFHLWSETYERSLEDIFALQDEISREVVERLRLELAGHGPLPKTETTDGEAHRLYLRGRHAWNRRTPSSIRSAIGYLEEAVARDPAYARAWAGLAEALVVFPQYAGVARDEWLHRAEAAAKRALALDPSLAEPHAVLGLLRAYGGSTEAETHYREALRLNPNYATARHWYAIYFGERGRYEDELREILLARSLDPLSPAIQANVGKAFLHLRRLDESIEAYRDLVASEPGFGLGHALLAEALSAAELHGEAAAAARRALDILGDDAHAEALASVGYALARAGDVERARRIVRALEEHAATPGLWPGAWGPAQVYVALGENELALEWIERAVAEEHQGGRTDLPFFDPLRDVKHLNASP